jgi:hypothetical protein
MQDEHTFPILSLAVHIHLRAYLAKGEVGANTPKRKMGAEAERERRVVGRTCGGGKKVCKYGCMCVYVTAPLNWT